jgi:hypothetical protein
VAWIGLVEEVTEQDEAILSFVKDLHVLRRDEGCLTPVFAELWATNVGLGSLEVDEKDVELGATSQCRFLNPEGLLHVDVEIEMSW